MMRKQGYKLAKTLTVFFESENYTKLSKVIDSNNLTPKFLLETGLSMFRLLIKKINDSSYYDDLAFGKNSAQDKTSKYLPKVIFDVVSLFIKQRLSLEEFVDLCNKTQSELISFDQDSSKYSLSFFRDLNGSLQNTLQILEKENTDTVFEKTLYLDKDIHLTIDSFLEQSEQLLDISRAIDQNNVIKFSEGSNCFVDLDKNDLLWLISDLTKKLRCLDTEQPTSILEIISNNPNSVIFETDKDEFSKLLEFHICGLKNNFFELQSEEKKFLEKFFTILHQESKR